jgi:hypothetical protein
MKRILHVKQTLIFVAALAGATITIPNNAVASFTYSGTGLNNLLYQNGGTPGDAQYVAAAAGAPALAQLYTADSGLSGNSPAVFISVPIAITLNSLVASYSLYGAATGPAGTSPYWILYMTDDTAFNNPIVADGGSTLNASSLVHVPGVTSGSITLAALDADIDPNSGLPYAQETVAYAGVEIGDWDNGANVISASANFDSLTIGAVPEPSTFISGALVLLPACASSLRRLRKNRKA